MTIEELEKMLSDRPNRISVNIETQATLNGYGIARTYEVKVELQVRHCTRCKQTSLIDPFCPVNGRHIEKEGWVLVAAGAGKTLSDALDRAVVKVPTLA
jgi:hypothetical protein